LIVEIQNKCNVVNVIVKTRGDWLNINNIFLYYNCFFIDLSFFCTGIKKENYSKIYRKIYKIYISRKQVFIIISFILWLLWLNPPSMHSCVSEKHRYIFIRKRNIMKNLNRIFFARYCKSSSLSLLSYSNKFDVSGVDNFCL